LGRRRRAVPRQLLSRDGGAGGGKPCALAIATPSAVLSGVAVQRGGVLVKGGAPLENLGSLKAIAFDKTGTLTEGRRASLMSCRSMAPMKASCWRWPAVEALSDHPLAQAIVKDAVANV
jgi:Cd2+/Zn2+-exporting ATPase